LFASQESDEPASKVAKSSISQHEDAIEEDKEGSDVVGLVSSNARDAA